MELHDLLAALAEKATKGPWGVWMEPIGGKDGAIRELIDQVHNTEPLIGHLVMLDADGKCPAITGCGPTSIPNASLIIELVNNLPTILAALKSATALAHAERLAEALGPFADGYGDRPSYIRFGDNTEILAEHWDSARSALAAYNAWRLP